MRNDRKSALDRMNSYPDRLKEGHIKIVAFWTSWYSSHERAPYPDFMFGDEHEWRLILTTRFKEIVE